MTSRIKKKNLAEPVLISMTKVEHPPIMCVCECVCVCASVCDPFGEMTLPPFRSAAPQCTDSGVAWHGVEAKDILKYCTVLYIQIDTNT